MVFVRDFRAALNNSGPILSMEKHNAVLWFRTTMKERHLPTVA